MDSELYGVAHSDELWYLWNIYFGVYYVNNRTEVGEAKNTHVLIGGKPGGTVAPHIKIKQFY